MECVLIFWVEEKRSGSMEEHMLCSEWMVDKVGEVTEIADRFLWLTSLSFVLLGCVTCCSAKLTYEP
jgi:hypothetical protein